MSNRQDQILCQIRWLLCNSSAELGRAKLKDWRKWINFMPKSINFYIQDNATTYHKAQSLNSQQPAYRHKSTHSMHSFRPSPNKNTNLKLKFHQILNKLDTTNPSFNLWFMTWSSSEATLSFKSPSSKKLWLVVRTLPSVSMALGSMYKEKFTGWISFSTKLENYDLLYFMFCDLN